MNKFEDHERSIIIGEEEFIVNDQTACFVALFDRVIKELSEIKDELHDMAHIINQVNY